MVLFLIFPISYVLRFLYFSNISLKNTNAAFSNKHLYILMPDLKLFYLNNHPFGIFLKKKNHNSNGNHFLVVTNKNSFLMMKKVMGHCFLRS